jgi:DNA-binding GntR family transcriptional regulator
MARVPIYQMIADDLRAQIASGELPVASQLPSEAELASRYGVSRMTVRQAMDQLENAKLVVRHRGSGSFVRDATSHTRGVKGLRSFAAELTAGGSTVDSRIVAQERRESAPAEVAAELALAKSSQYVRLARVRLVDGTPASYQEAWIPFSVAPGLTREDLIDGSLYRTLAVRYGVELGWADQVISSTLATAEIADLLEEKVGNSLLTIRRTTYSTSNLPVEFVKSWTRASFPLALRLEAD